MSKNSSTTPPRMTTIGGQALIEGLMMIGPDNASAAVRKPDGEIIIKEMKLPVKGRLAKIPFVRGAILIVKQMVLGMQALFFSAEFADLGEDKPNATQDESPENKAQNGKFKDFFLYSAVFVSLLFSVGLFILIPNIIASAMHFNKQVYSGVIYYNLFEGLVRITLFTLYIVSMSAMKDIQRIWSYHGAEHKAIHCYEHKEDLTVENIKKYPTLHPRCGTSFLFTVMIISILVFSFTGWHNPLLNIAIRLLLIPVIAGISYEIVKIVGKSCSPIARVLNYPGMMFQKFTTREPDDAQIEVAIAAINSVLPKEENSDKW